MAWLKNWMKRYWEEHDKIIISRASVPIIRNLFGWNPRRYDIEVGKKVQDAGRDTGLKAGVDSPSSQDIV